MSRGTGFAAFGTRPKYCVTTAAPARVEVADDRHVAFSGT
jgi:hypothetical protein